MVINTTIAIYITLGFINYILTVSITCTGGIGINTIPRFKHGSIQCPRLVRLCSRLTNSDHTGSLIQSNVVAADEVAWVDVSVTDVVAVHILEIVFIVHVVGRNEISLSNLDICIQESVCTACRDENRIDFLDLLRSEEFFQMNNLNVIAVDNCFTNHSVILITELNSITGSLWIIMRFTTTDSDCHVLSLPW